MSERDKVDENVAPVQVASIPEQKKPLKASPHIKEIDAMLFSSLPIAKIVIMVKEQFGENYHFDTFRRRRVELRQQVKVANAAIDKISEVKAAEQKSLTYELKSLEQSAVEVMKLEVEPNHPQAKALKALKEQIESFMHRSAELFGEIDFLAVMRYTINVQLLRVAKMLELELQMGIPMRDNTINIRELRHSLKDGLDMYKELGLTPKFGDPLENLKANLGGSGSEQQSTAVGYSDRQRQLKAMADEIKALPPELKEKRSRELLIEMMNRIVPVNAKIIEEKNDKPDLAT